MNFLSALLCLFVYLTKRLKDNLHICTESYWFEASLICHNYFLLCYSSSFLFGQQMPVPGCVRWDKDVNKSSYYYWSSYLVGLVVFHAFTHQTVVAIVVAVMRTRYILYCMNANTNKMKTKLNDQLKSLSMDGNIEELTYCLLQGGGDIRKWAAYYHPSPQRNLQYVFDQNGGTKQWTDMDRQLDLAVEEGTIQPAATALESLTI